MNIKAIRNDNYDNDAHNINLDVLRKNILYLIKKAKINTAQLAKKVNVPQPTIHRLVSGEMEDPKLSILNNIAKYFSLSLDELITNEIEFKNELNKNPSLLDNNIVKRVFQIPIINWNEAVNYEVFTSTLDLKNWSDWLVVDEISTNNAFVLKSKRSMEPRFPLNSLLIVDVNLEPLDGDLVIVHFKDTKEVTIREIILDGPIQKLAHITEKLPLHQVNDETKIIGVVIQTRYLYK